MPLSSSIPHTSARHRVGSIPNLRGHRTTAETSITSPRYSDTAQTDNSGTSGSSDQKNSVGGNDHTFGVQVNWNIGQPGPGRDSEDPQLPRAGDVHDAAAAEDPPTIRQRPSATSSILREGVRASRSSSRVDLASRRSLSTNGRPIDG